MSKRPAGQSSEEMAEAAHNSQELGRPEGDTSKRAKGPWDSSAGGSSGPTALPPNAFVAGEFGRFAVKALTDGLPGKVTGLMEAAVLSTHASNLIFRAAEEEEQSRFEKERDADVARARETELRLCQARLNEEKHQRAILSRKVRTLSLMAPVLKKARQECREAKIAQLALLKNLELTRAELARAKAENAELKIAGLLRESAREEESLRTSVAGGGRSKAPQT